MVLVKKVCMLGDPAVGKTSLVKRYIMDTFDERYVSTVGTRVLKKVVPTKKEEVTMMIWDILGQHTYKLLHYAVLQGAVGAVVVCDVEREDTLGNLDYWVNLIKDANSSAKCVIVVNKSDLIENAAFDKGKVEEYATQHESPFYYTSAKTDEGVKDAFEALAEIMVKE